MLLLAKKEFFAGIFLAFVAVAALVGVQSLYAEAAVKTVPEVDFSQRLGLFDAERLSTKVLRSNISELAFQRALNVVLVKIGVVRRYDMTELIELGIIRAGATNNSMSRLNAAKTIMRSIVHGWYREALKRDGIKHVNPFSDLHLESRYSEPLTYAVQHGIFRGSTGSKFNPEGRLKVIEALAFLKRLYEDATGVKDSGAVYRASEPVKGKIELLCKEDEQEFAAQFERLKKAGVFSFTNLGGKVCGDSAVLTIDMGNMFLGVLKNLHAPGYVSQIKYYAQTSEETYANRDLLACMAANLVAAIPHKTFKDKVVYSDIAPYSEVDHALNKLARAGIRMGYTDSQFKGYERVSVYEVFGLIDKVLTDLQPAPMSNGLMTPEEVDSWKRNLAIRKDIIKRIINNY